LRHVETGISFKAHGSGLQVTALKAGTSAANSGLEVDDVITIVDRGEEQFLLSGLSFQAALDKVNGVR
jgi:C-terminal processing protease CtpA/Prc